MGGVGTRKPRPLLFTLKFCIIFIEFSAYIAGKCHGHSFLNFWIRLPLGNPQSQTKVVGKVGDITEQLRAQTFQFCTAFGIDCKTVGIFSRFSAVN